MYLKRIKFSLTFFVYRMLSVIVHYLKTLRNLCSLYIFSLAISVIISIACYADNDAMTDLGVPALHTIIR